MKKFKSILIILILYILLSLPETSNLTKRLLKIKNDIHIIYIHTFILFTLLLILFYYNSNKLDNEEENIYEEKK